MKIKKFDFVINAAEGIISMNAKLNENPEEFLLKYNTFQAVSDLCACAGDGWTIIWSDHRPMFLTWAMLGKQENIQMSYDN
jgi:hypothetical protein